MINLATISDRVALSAVAVNAAITVSGKIVFNCEILISCHGWISHIASAKQIKHKNKISYLKKYIKNSKNLNDLDNLKAAIVTPDYDIIPDAQKLTPAYLVFDNYEIILKWNRSLRFALAVCTLKEKIKNEL